MTSRPPDPTDLPDRVGPYRIERRLGVGGMGAVYRAYDERLGRRVAIKRILLDVSADDRMRERFRREAQAVARVNHPAVVQIHDILQEADDDWIVMELIEGTPLGRLAARRGLALDLTLHLTTQIADGLDAVHRQGIIHRDLKMENVMVTADGRAKLLDFGLAKALEPLAPGGVDLTLSTEGAVLGTSRTMSPEQAMGRPLDHRSDLFSLGVLLYELVTGVSPFRGRSLIETLARVCSQQQTRAREHSPALPLPLCDLIEELLAKAPEQRPGAASAVAARLRNLRNALPVDLRALRPTHRFEDAAPQGADASDDPADAAAQGDATTAIADSLGVDSLSVDDGTRPLRPSDLTDGGDPAEAAEAPVDPGADAIAAPAPSAVLPAGAIPAGALGTDTLSFLASSTAGVFVKALLVLEPLGRGRLLQGRGENQALDAQARHDRLVRDLIARFDGIEIDRADDFLLLFQRPSDALRCALAYQAALAALSAELDEPMRGRAALHVGEVMVRETTSGDQARGARPHELEGLARRLVRGVARLARPNQILMTQSVHDLTRHALGEHAEDGALLRWKAHGSHRLADLDTAVQLFEAGARGRASFRRPRTGRARSATLLAVAAIGVMLAALVVWRLSVGDGQPLLAGLPGLSTGIGDAARPTAAILGFDNTSKSPEHDWISTAIAEIIASDLAGAPALRLIAGETVDRLRRELDLVPASRLDDDTLDRIRQNLGCRYVILGSYIASPDLSDLRINVNVQDTTTAEVIATTRSSGQLNELIAVAAALGTDLRDELALGDSTAQTAAAVRA
ncbi:MAG: protein kinase, partial [Acidobacteriota bacterium]